MVYNQRNEFQTYGILDGKPNNNPQLLFPNT